MRYDSNETIIVTPFDSESYRNNGKTFSNETGLNQEQFDPRFYTHDNKCVYCHSCRDLVKYTDSIETYITVPKKINRKGETTYEYQEVSYCHSCFSKIEAEEAKQKSGFIKYVMVFIAFVFCIFAIDHYEQQKETDRLKAIMQKYKDNPTKHTK